MRPHLFFRLFASMHARLVGLAVACCLAGPARGQPLAVDPAFAPVLISRQIDYEKVTLQPLADGGYLAGGLFVYAGNRPVLNIARLGADGEADPGFSLPFTRSLLAEDLVIPLGDGRLLVVQFEYDAVAHQAGARFTRHLANGAADPAFTSFAIPRGYVRFARPASGGRHVLFGNFASIGGQTRAGIARLNADGTLDTAYAPAIVGPTTVVTSAVIDAADRIYATGYAAYPGPGGNFFVRLLADGTRDTTFNPVPPVSAGASPHQLLAAHPDGRVILGVTSPVRLLADGSHDAAFSPDIPASHTVARIIPLPQGRLLIDAQPRLDAAAQSSVLRILDDAGVLALDMSSTFPTDPALSCRGLAADGSLLVVHGRWVITFQDFVGPTAGINPSFVPPAQRELREARVSRVSLDGVVLATYTPALGRQGFVEQVAAAPDGGVFISGDIDQVGADVRPGVARLRADGTVDQSFNLPDTGGRQARLLHVQRDGKLLVHLPAQTGTIAGSRARRLLPDGTLDATLAADSDFARATNVRVLDVDADGGIWSSVLELDSALNPKEVITRFEADGRLVARLPSRFSDSYLVFPARIEATVVTLQSLVTGAQMLPDGDLLVAGHFTRVDNMPSVGLVRLNPDGSPDTDYAPALAANSLVGIPQLVSGGRAIVALADPPSTTVRYRSIRLLPDGTEDPMFQPAPDEIITSFIEQPDGSLLGQGPLLRRWMPDGLRDLNVALPFGASSSSYAISYATATDGAIYAGGMFASAGGLSRTGLARIVPAPSPGITVQPQPRTTVAGRTVALQVAIGDAAPATYQWQRNGVDLPGADRALLVLNAARAADAGEYRVIVRVGATTYVSTPVTVTVLPTTARLTNFSARSRVRPASPPQIAGFVLEGAEPRPLLLRAVCQGLPWPIGSERLPRSRLGAFSDSTELSFDIGGGRASSIEAIASRVGAFLLNSPVTPRPIGPVGDSALSLALPAGVFTAQTTSADDREGVSLFEFYDASENPDPGAVRNVSLRGRTAPGVDTMIGGFVIAGNGPLRVLIRAVGPELGQLGIAEALADPQLRLFASPWGEIAVNDDWQQQRPPGHVIPLIRAEDTTGAFPLQPGSRSAVLLIALEPGAYTAHAVGAGGSAGEVLLEIYVVPE